VRGEKTPNTKLQAPEKPQIPRSRSGAIISRIWSLVFGAFLVFGVWCLVFSTSTIGAQEEKIPPLRPPKNELGLSFWQRYGWWVALGALVAVVLIAFMVILLRRPKTQQVTPPQLAARRALEALRGRADDVTLAVEVSHIFRVYLYFALNLPAEELTTAELSALLRSPRLGDADLANTTSDFLKRCDEKKFAPSTDEPPVRFVDAACHLIDRLETLRQRRLEEAERERSADGSPVAA
jgi:hypothetical protein